MFAEYDIHFIAINDGVDSEREDNDFTPIRNLFNEFYISFSKFLNGVMSIVEPFAISTPSVTAM